MEGQAEVEDAIALLRALGDDHQHVEVKQATGGFPGESLLRTLSAFSNTRGGVVILGLEPTNFTALGVYDPKDAITKFANACKTSVTPELRPSIEVVDFEGVHLVVARIDELESDLKPARVTSTGAAYRRVGDGDLKLSPYEIQILRERSASPDYDCRPIDGTSKTDLDGVELSRYLERIRERTRIDGESDDEILIRHRVLDQDGRATLAGLLAFGAFPQQFVPQLYASFVAFAQADGTSLDGVKFLHNVRLEGNIGEILGEAEKALKGQMSRRAEAVGMQVRDHWEYPPLALREAIANALVHRDLSSSAVSRPVQIELYPDRLQITSPGGLFGSVTEENIVDGITSSRNGCLMRILEDVHTRSGSRIAESRGTGIREILAALRAQGGTATFEDTLSSFVVTFPASSFLTPEVQFWLEGLNEAGLTESQITGLAMMKSGIRLDNPAYRQATGADSQDARSELQDLVHRGLAIQIGQTRWTRYVLAGAKTKQRGRKSRHERYVEILDVIGNVVLSRAQVTDYLGLSDRYVRNLLSDLVRSGHLEITTKPQSINAQYRATGKSLGAAEQQQLGI